MPPIFSPNFQRTILGILPRTIFLSSTGLSPYIVLLSRRLQVRKMVLMEVHNTTSPSYCYNGFSLNWAVFSRSYLRHLYWFLFLQVLRRFNSLRSLTSKGITEKTHSDISGSTSTFDSPEHFVACHVLLQQLEPSHSPSSMRVVNLYMDH